LNRLVLGWEPACYPFIAVDVDVRDGLAGHPPDDSGSVGEGERLATGERVLGADIFLRIGDGRRRDGGDVLGVSLRGLSGKQVCDDDDDAAGAERAVGGRRATEAGLGGRAGRPGPAPKASN
jgi:hypothetical protein